MGCGGGGQCASYSRPWYSRIFGENKFCSFCQLLHTKKLINPLAFILNKLIKTKTRIKKIIFRSFFFFFVDKLGKVDIERGSGEYFGRAEHPKWRDSIYRSHSSLPVPPPSFQSPCFIKRKMFATYLELTLRLSFSSLHTMYLSPL